MYRTKLANYNALYAAFHSYFINIKNVHDNFTRGSHGLFHKVIGTNYRQH